MADLAFINLSFDITLNGIDIFAGGFSSSLY